MSTDSPGGQVAMEPALRLAFSVSGNKGAYALLLGSGISSNAGIPTGWKVTLDLIRTVARLRGHELEAEAELLTWYRNEFTTDPNYSDILEQIAATPVKRNAILRGYFLATPEQREQNIKVPTEAHRAIAEVVASGYVRVIVTTNFDQLLEEALKEAGVDAQVISTVDAIDGALPLAHAACTVVKVHGDYQDARILNTVDELSEYRPTMNNLLDRIFDEYGLIVCGWSGESDIALCSALQRRRSRRYTTYWTIRDRVKAEAQRLIEHLGAETITTPGADEFFRNLSESVKAIEDTAQPHPLSARVAEATVKRYVVDDRYRVLLNDLVIREATRVYESVNGPSSPSLSKPLVGQELERRLAFYEGQAQTLMAMMIGGCYWGEQTHHRLWGRALQRVSRFASPPGSRYDEATYLRLYPALLALYAGGMASVAAYRYDTLAALLLQEGWPDPQYTGTLPMALHLSPTRPLSGALVKKVSGYEKRTRPTSNYLYWKSGLLEATRDIRWDDADYRSLFDWFEFFLGLVIWDLTDKLWNEPWTLYGAFQFTDNYSGNYATIKPVQRFESEINTVGAEWAPLKADFFSGSLSR